MSGYLDLAKKTIEKAPMLVTEEECAERSQRKLENAGRRGLVISWSEYPDWLALHDPLTGKWHELPASDCFPSLVEEADVRRKRGQPRRREQKPR